ncbi:MAG: triosephosphate isomerase [Bdellovibrionales bacterium]|nr:triosephosphate isomerase [Bdellovibrionales bacterium]
MNMGYQQALSFLLEFNKLVKKEDKDSFIFFPPAPLSLIFEKEKFYWGSQNIYQKIKGALTGENSVQLFKEMGATFCLLGHSERRYIFGETDVDIEKKFSLVQEQALIPVLCIGESLSERFQKNKVLIKKLSWIKQYNKYEKLPFHPEKLPPDFKDLSFIVAYEPLWSIGTGEIPSVSELEDVISLIKEDFPTVKVFYGGSVSLENALSLSCDKLDGFLIGSESVNPHSFYGIYKQIKSC